MAWFDWYSGRLEKELEALRNTENVEFEIDEKAKEAGVIRLLLKFTHEGDTVDLIALYPEFFPYFPPEVFAPHRLFRRHQDPISRNLCLLGRRSERWCSDWTLAEILPASLTAIMDFDRTGDEKKMAGLEERQGEPVSDYLNNKGISDSIAIYDSEFDIGEVKFGWLELSLDNISPPRAILSRILDADRNTLARWDAYPPLSATQRMIPWARTEERLKGSIEEIRAIYENKENAHLRPKRSTVSSKHYFALTFREETAQFSYQLGWLVFETGKKKDSAIRPIKTFRAGDVDLAARMPTVGLSARTATVLGLGAIGSVIAFELARNGIANIHVVDFDFVEPATVRRWVSGRPSFGQSKIQAFHDLVVREYPTTKVNPVEMKVGAYRDPPQDDYAKLIDVISKSDVVIDTSIEVGVNALISRICWQMNKPYIVASASPGAWGGRVCRFDKSRGDACWVCYQNDLEERGAAYQPPADPSGELQPPGCAARTFTGTSFDLAEIAMEAVRTVISVMPSSSYPSIPQQVSICGMRDDKGNRVLPTWREVVVSRMKDCSCVGT